MSSRGVDVSAVLRLCNILVVIVVAVAAAA